jgi:putative ABC transport system permease protein
VVNQLWQDLKFALRTLVKSPGFTVVAVLTLALGIGANTAIFTVVNAVLLNPLPYPDPNRIVKLIRTFPQGIGNSISIPEFIVWREQTQVFHAVTAYETGSAGVNLTQGDQPERLTAIRVSEGYFRVFGARIAMGRTFSTEEDLPGGPKVAVVSNGLWRRRFGGDPSLVSQKISLGGEPYTIVGVLGSEFTSNPSSDLWLPLQADVNSVNQGHYLTVVARLNSAITLENANAAMKVAVEEFRRKFPEDIDKGESAEARPLRDLMVIEARPTLLLLLGAVGFVLLIACVNVANLQLARATRRRREIAIRSALGAVRRRLIRQLLTESVMISIMGGSLGLALGYVGVRALLAINPGNIPRIGEHGSAVTIDWRVLVFTSVMSFLIGILSGLIPALAVSRTDLSATLKESGARSGTGLRHNKTRSLLVTIEIALAVVLLAGAGLLIRTFKAMQTVDPGFDGHNVLTMEMSLSGKRFEKTAGVSQLVRDAERRIESLPGASAAAVSSMIPLDTSSTVDLPFTIEGLPPTNGRWTGDVQWRCISPRYFDVFRIPLLRGRLFTDNDDGAASGVVVVNEAMARKFWPTGDLLGQRITIGHGLGPEFEEPPRQIIGIIGNVRDGSLSRSPEPIMYVPVAQVTNGVNALLNGVIPIRWEIRTKVEPHSLGVAIQQEIRTASGGLPVARIRSMDQVTTESTARTKFNTTLLSIFAGIALLLAAIGIYGLMSYSVQQRTQEIGIRMALGAESGSVRTMVILQGMRLALIGVVIGTAAAFGLARFMGSFLFGVRPWDPAAFITVPIILCAVALIAAWVPALRASRVHPMVALRHE